MKILFLIMLFLNIFNNLFGEVNEEKKLIEIYKNLRCLVCQGQSIADSNSDFSQTIKFVVKDQMNQGMNEDEIYSFLIDKYGEWIVYKPRFNVENFLLWFLPYFVLLIGGVIFFVILKKSKNHRAN
ncbi:cytochrome c-type biogenesis protein CcmH [Pelagibacteraceae bacterium]|nr:cytochrome c-type biogenesis protein CcmH [Pelagibacteraceae bacterium]|tara:strand:+ start:77 stop:454 length:378 start_codon:yes stop_codon:yes gene_type:complete